MHTNLKVMYYNLHDSYDYYGLKSAAKRILELLELKTPPEWVGSDVSSTFNFSADDRHQLNYHNQTVLQYLQMTKITEAMRNVLGAHTPVGGKWKRYEGSIQEAWLNVFNQGQVLAPRRQRGTRIFVDAADNGWSAACYCYFIQVDEDNPCFYFIDEEGNKSYINEKNNSLLIFSPDLRYGVDQNPSTNQTIMMMGNSSFVFELVGNDIEESIDE